MIVRVTHSAVLDWQLQIDRGASRQAALQAILRAVLRARVVLEHARRQDGREVWRGPKPLSARFLVERHPDGCDVVAVLPDHGGLRRSIGPTDEHQIAGSVELPGMQDPPSQPASPAPQPAASEPNRESPAAPIALTRRTEPGRRPLLGRLLREEREAQGLRMDELAAMADLDDDVVLDLERGYGATDEALWRVCEALGVELTLRPR